jgi:hypothetical protein
MICLSGGVPSAGAGTVGVEAENLFSSFIARAGHELRCSDRCGNSSLYRIYVVSAATWPRMKRYHVGRAPATGQQNNYAWVLASGSHEASEIQIHESD